MPDGRTVEVYTLSNVNGLIARVLTLGGIIQSVRAPDRAGAFGDTVLGYPNLAGYLDDTGYIGALVGRFAGRIAGGMIEVDGERHTLSKNAGDATLHGGAIGFDKVIWSARVVSERLVLNHLSPDGDQGFPGAVDVEATIELTDADELRLSCRATTSRATVINLTHHGYWNFSGGGSVRDHRLQAPADQVLETDGMIPTGGLLPIAGTALDLKRARQLGEVIDATGGIDHTFVLSGSPARLSDPDSGRVLEVRTDQPGLTVYTANGFDGAFAPFSGVALEAEHFPDSPRHPGFPSTLLRPGEIYRWATVYRLGVD